MSIEQIARNLRYKLTAEERELWRALRGRRFAGFKFRRQHVLSEHVFDFYCADAKLAVELDGFQHGRPDKIRRDAARDRSLADEGIMTLRFWNHEWRRNRRGCLLEIWNALQLRTGCVQIIKGSGEQRFVPPLQDKIKVRHSELKLD